MHNKINLVKPATPVMHSKLPKETLKKKKIWNPKLKHGDEKDQIFLAENQNRRTKKMKERRTVRTGMGERDRTGGEGGGEGENQEWRRLVRKKTANKKSRGFSEVSGNVRELLVSGDGEEDGTASDLTTRV